MLGGSALLLNRIMAKLVWNCHPCHNHRCLKHGIKSLLETELKEACMYNSQG